MPTSIRIEEHAAGVRVLSPDWQLEHLRAAGGAWSSIVFSQGSGKNLLRAPLTSALRFVRVDPKAGAVFSSFEERNEKDPRLFIEHTADGAPVVIAEGTFRDAAGKTIPVGYRRRTEYREYGLIWSTLDIMSDSGCDGIVELRALELPLRRGLTDAFARFHPTQAGTPDLLGGRGWFDLSKNGTAFLSRFTPLQLQVMQKDSDGIELFPPSELAPWDTGVKPDAGLGEYAIVQADDGATVTLSPYCLAQRRIPARVQGKLSLTLGIGLPDLNPEKRARVPIAFATIPSLWKNESALTKMAADGTKLVCVHHSCSDGGDFWRAGVYPPYDETGMKKLRALVENAHRAGLKIVVSVSPKEFHPEAPAFKENAANWMHMAAPSLEMLHNWATGGETGALMCLKSGWLEFCKRQVTAMLADIPWDGIFVGGAAPLPCCHPAHSRGALHSDVEQTFDFLALCRQKAGDNGILLLSSNSGPSYVAENIADAVI